jgi:hypothetical protein
MAARTIRLILAPAVMVTACAILQGGLLAHYAAVSGCWHLKVFKIKPDDGRFGQL